MSGQDLRIARELCRFVDAAPSPFHACAEVARALEGAGFRRLRELDAWPQAPGRAYVVRGGSPTYLDRMVSQRLSAAAVEALLAGRTAEMAAWQPWTREEGVATEDPSVWRFPLTRVLKETEALIDGASSVTKRRVRMMEAYEGVLAL